MRVAAALSPVLIGFCLAPAAAVAQYTPAEISIRQAVESRLSNKSIEGVMAIVAGGNVTLIGEVRSLWEKNRAREEAWEANTIGGVYDRVTVRRGSDEKIRGDVTHNIHDHVFYSIFDNVDIEVGDGIVTLTGDVTELFKFDNFAEVASRVSGVQRIRNGIRPLGTSSSDARLREVIARRIYGEPLFWNDATLPRPSIHIIVSDGRVTLTGTVSSEAKRRAAELITCGIEGVVSCENRLRSVPDS